MAGVLETRAPPGMGRRQFIHGLTLPAVAISLPSLALGAGSNSLIPLKAAGYRFPRVEALFDGSISIDGCKVAFEEVGIGDANTDTFGHSQTRDLTEIGLIPYTLAYANQGFRDYTLLPIFPLRLFRHKSIFIRTDRGIKSPEDLRGKSIATPGYSSTSLVWIRGLLNDEYGVSPDEINWVLSNKDSSADVSGKVSDQENILPAGINIIPGPPGLDESELLVNGEVDALFHAATPRAFLENDPKVARLFSDSREVEQAYYGKTGIFPIMHAVAVRQSLLDEHPWIAKAIFDAYAKAKSQSYAYMAKLGWAADMLPWYGQEMEHTKSVMGPNFYSYGLGPNQKTLETLFRYSHEQGLAKRQLTVDEVFLPASFEFSDI